MPSEFDRDTALTKRGDGWHGTITDRWHIRRGPNGGFIAAFVLGAMLRESPFPDPLTTTTHYLSAPVVGPARVTVEPLRIGRSHATLAATLHQSERRAITIGTFGTLREGGLESVQHEMPVVSPAGQSERRLTGSDGHDEMPIRQRLVQLVPPEMASVWEEPGPARAGGWTRFPDRALDAHGVPLFMDCWPPSMFATFMGGFAPTIELTVHFRSRPHTEWHLALFRSRFLMQGYVEEDGELWGEDGRLVAQSRQLALFVSPDPPDAE